MSVFVCWIEMYLKQKDERNSPSSSKNGRTSGSKQGLPGRVPGAGRRASGERLSPLSASASPLAPASQRPCSAARVKQRPTSLPMGRLYEQFTEDVCPGPHV